MRRTDEALGVGGYPKRKRAAVAGLGADLRTRDLHLGRGNRRMLRSINNSPVDLGLLRLSRCRKCEHRDQRGAQPDTEPRANKLSAHESPCGPKSE